MRWPSSPTPEERRERAEHPAGLLLALTTAAISGVAVFLNGYGVRAVQDAAVYTTGKKDAAAGPGGHVAVVTKVLADGSVLSPQYNGHDRSLKLLHLRAPRHLDIGVDSSLNAPPRVRRQGSPPTAAMSHGLTAPTVRVTTGHRFP